MLFTLFVDTDPFESEVSTWSEMRLHGAREEIGWVILKSDTPLGMILNLRVIIPAISIAPQNAAISDVRTGAGRSTDFAVALGKVQVADGEFAAFDVDGHVRLAAP